MNLPLLKRSTKVGKEKKSRFSYRGKCPYIYRHVHIYTRDREKRKAIEHFQYAPSEERIHVHSQIVGVRVYRGKPFQQNRIHAREREREQASDRDGVSRK